MCTQVAAKRPDLGLQPTAAHASICAVAAEAGRHADTEDEMFVPMWLGIPLFVVVVLAVGWLVLILAAGIRCLSRM